MKSLQPPRASNKVPVAPNVDATEPPVRCLLTLPLFDLQFVSDTVKVRPLFHFRTFVSFWLGSVRLAPRPSANNKLSASTYHVEVVHGDGPEIPSLSVYELQLPLLSELTCFSEIIVQNYSFGTLLLNWGKGLSSSYALAVLEAQQQKLYSPIRPSSFRRLEISQTKIIGL